MSMERTRRITGKVDGDVGSRLDFLLEADRLKDVERRNLTTGGRRERTAEHSWHFALAALVLADLADEPVDLCRVVQMALVHDLVEIDAGDTYVYDSDALAAKRSKEEAAADRLFAIAPGGDGLRALWEEYEARDTPEARFAHALDRLLPLLLNHASGGHSWREHQLGSEQVNAVNAAIGDGSQRLWHVARSLIADGIEAGWLGGPGGS